MLRTLFLGPDSHAIGRFLRRQFFVQCHDSYITETKLALSADRGLGRVGQGIAAA